MSNLEGRVKDGLLPMVRGEPVRLAPSMVANIGTWAAMKGILVEYADRPNHVVQGVAEDVRRYLGQNHSPSSHTLVLAAKIEPIELAFAVFTGRVRSKVGHIMRVYLSAFSLRSVAFLTLIGNLERWERDALGSEPNRVVRVWPYRELVWIDWPPSGEPFTIQAFHHFNQTTWRT
jgi:hypothetical protein